MSLRKHRHITEAEGLLWLQQLHNPDMDRMRVLVCMCLPWIISASLQPPKLNRTDWHYVKIHSLLRRWLWMSSLPEHAVQLHQTRVLSQSRQGLHMCFGEPRRQEHQPAVSTGSLTCPSDESAGPLNRIHTGHMQNSLPHSRDCQSMQRA